MSKMSRSSLAKSVSSCVKSSGNNGSRRSAPDAPVSELANWSNPFMTVPPKRLAQGFARAPQSCIDGLTGQARLGADLFCWRQLEIAHQHQAPIQRIELVERVV